MQVVRSDSNSPAFVEAKPSPLWLWLYGRGNLWGSVLGLVGVALFYAGVIGAGWLAIVGGLYAIGYFAAPKPAAQSFALAITASGADIRQRLEEMQAALTAAAGPETLAAFVRLKGHVLELLPRLEGPGLTIDDRTLLHETASRYLPETLANYLKLPALYRRYHPVRDGKTAEALLAEQLTVIDGELQTLAERLYRADAQDLLVQGRFLKDKFERPELIARDGSSA